MSSRQINLVQWWKKASFQKEASWKDIILFLKKPGIIIPIGIASALSLAYWFMGRGGQPIDFLEIIRNSPSTQVAKSELEQKIQSDIEIVKPGELSFLEKKEQPVPEKKLLNNKELPRGIRNNNPGNIEWNSNVKWQGILTNEASDGRFARFESPEYGLRAMARVLRTYQRRYGLDTLEKIISRWAPPGENDTSSYVRQVSKNSRIPSRQKINLEDDQILANLLKAMIKHENGMNPYTDEQIINGVRMEKNR